MMMLRKTKLTLACLGLFLCSNYAQTVSSFEQFWADAQNPDMASKSEESKHRIKWWRNARFGMFIHWDPSSLAASEISWSKQFYDDDGENMWDNPRPSPELYNIHEHQFWLNWFKPPVPRNVYDNLYKSFYPGMFNADTIVDIAKKAGMKYIIQITKHHNGFCMWDSEFTDYDIMSTPFRRDIIGEMARACERSDMKFGIYYSQRDWHHPDYGPERMNKYNEYMYNQIKELLTRYPNISIIFFDSEQYYPWQMWNGRELFKMIHQLRPNIIINDRCGVPADYSTPEQKIGQFNKKRSWESCMTLTGFWSWHGFQTPIISYETCLKYLISCAGGDGNLLMNVGPMPTGQIDPREEDRLKMVGEWLKINGESIYGTHGGPFLPDSNYASTYKDNQIYLHVFRRQNGTIVLPGIREKVMEVRILAGPKISFTQTDKNISFTLPEGYFKNIVTVVKLDLDRPLNEEQIPIKFMRIN
ncbi:MAG: alpha-L-fucosidase [Bacteroidia bacterium]|nr:alpha-L-fucosidase [Bacteroidia bacterium]